MSSNNPDSSIIKNVRIIEWIKAEIISGSGALFKAMIKNNEEMILDSLAGLVMECYFLGKRLGVPFERLDARIEQKLQSSQLQEHEIEEWYGDVTNFQNYLKERNQG
ncbi:MAG: MazG-like family protein [Bacillota bacterium]